MPYLIIAIIVMTLTYIICKKRDDKCTDSPQGVGQWTNTVVAMIILRYLHGLSTLTIVWDTSNEKYLIIPVLGWSIIGIILYFNFPKMTKVLTIFGTLFSIVMILWTGWIYLTYPSIEGAAQAGKIFFKELSSLFK